MRVTCCTLLATALAIGLVHAGQQSAKADVVDTCRLQTEPSKYNHKLVDVTGFVSHGFENFSFSESGCAGKSMIWLEYGGNVNSETIYCCGPVAGARRKGTLVVEGTTLPLVDDAMFRRFDERIRKRDDVEFRARMIGRFFTGQKTQPPGGDEYWGGYGHLGCCTLLVIQQVLALDGTEPDAHPF